MSTNLTQLTTGMAHPIPVPWPAESPDDMSLVHSAKAGDTEAFAALVTKYQKRVMRVAFAIMKNQEDAEDVSQTIFLKAFRHLEGFRELSSFSTWITSIAVNESLMELRRRRRAVVVSLNASEEEHNGGRALDVQHPGLSPEQICNQDQVRTLLAKALGKLSPLLRIVFVLRDVEGLSTQETAQALDVSIETVKTRLLRARLALRKHLQKSLAPERPCLRGAVGLLSALL